MERRGRRNLVEISTRASSPIMACIENLNRYKIENKQSQFNNAKVFDLLLG